MAMAMVMKKHRDRGVDRLSALPDSLLIHILSFVSKEAGIYNVWSESYTLAEVADVKKTAVTSVLSKRWRYLWSELPVLSFQEKSIKMGKIRKFVDMVTRTLSIRSPKYLDKFYLNFRFSQIWAASVDGWLAFASDSKAKVVSLVLLPQEDAVEYVLPEIFYRNSWLKELELAYCLVAPQGRVDWRCLSRLEFSQMELGEDVIENILSGCPVLYSLGLSNCWGFERLNIKSGSVGRVGVWDGSMEDDEDVNQTLDISAPYIHCLDVSSAGKTRKIRARNIPCVVEALISIRAVADFEVATREDRSDAIEWIEATSHVLKLHLTEHFFMLLAQAVVEDGWLFPQSKRVSLKVETAALEASDEVTIVALVNLLDSSPHLEKFEVSIWPRVCDPLNYQPLGLRSDDFSCCDYLHLKCVEIKCFVEDDVPMDIDIVLLLARVLLRRAKVLEKMIIRVNVDFIPELKKMVEEIKCYPRSSEQAQLLIRPHYCVF